MILRSVSNIEYCIVFDFCKNYLWVLNESFNVNIKFLKLGLLISDISPEIKVLGNYFLVMPEKILDEFLFHTKFVRHEPRY